MNNLERIEEAAFDLFLYESGDMSKYRGRALAIELAISDEAKEFHQQEMYSEEEVKKISLYAAEHAQDNHMQYPYEWFDEWFENNKKKL